MAAPPRRSTSRSSWATGNHSPERSTWAKAGMLKRGINNRNRGRALFITLLEDILQSKLQDSRIERRPKNSKRIAGQVRVGISRPEAVCQIERFDPEFQPLAFTDIKCSRHGHIQRPCCRTTDDVTSHVAQRA